MFLHKHRMPEWDRPGHLRLRPKPRVHFYIKPSIDSTFGITIEMGGERFLKELFVKQADQLML